jgi:protein-glutamine gamma-glutamyltransferase
MKLLRSYRMLRFTLVLSAILAQCVALGNFPLLVIAGTLALLSWYVTEGPRGRAMPPWIARLLVLVVLLYAGFDAFGPLERLPLVLGQFVVWLTIIKLYGKRTVENEAQLLLLGFLLMTVGALYTNGFIFGIMLVVWSGFAAWVLLLYQLHHGMETMQQERYSAGPSDFAVPWARPVTGLHVRREFRQTATMFLLFGLMGSVAFFVAMPREKLEKLPGLAASTNIMLERMELSPSNDDLSSNQQVMSVSLKDVLGNTVRMQEGLRLRGTVLDAYRGHGVWETGLHYKSTIVTLEGEITPLTMPGDGKTNLFMEVELQQPVSRVFTLYRPIGLETVPPSRITQNLANSTLKLALGAEPIQRYTVEVDFTPVVISPISTNAQQYQNEQVQSLALSLLEKFEIDVEQITSSPQLSKRAARIFEDYLQSNEFMYSLDGADFSAQERIAMSEDSDPIASFILKYKRGHCEYFAAAMAAMCDTVQIPARVVTGYYVDRWDEVSEAYIVYQRDAHAWVEVEVEPMTWMTYDPTPTSEDTASQEGSATLAQSIRVVWQKWELSWQAYVIGFDSIAQRSLVGFIDPLWRSHRDSLIGALDAIYSGVVRWFDIGAGGRIWIDLVMGAATLSGFAILIVRWRKRRTKKLLSLSTKVDEHVPVASVEFYAKLQRVLFGRGRVRPRHLPTQMWITGLQLDEESAALANSLTETYYRIRFGGYRPSRSKRLALMRRVHRFESLLRKGTS